MSTQSQLHTTRFFKAEAAHQLFVKTLCFFTVAAGNLLTISKNAAEKQQDLQNSLQEATLLMAWLLQPFGSSVPHDKG